VRGGRSNRVGKNVVGDGGFKTEKDGKSRGRTTRTGTRIFSTNRAAGKKACKKRSGFKRRRCSVPKRGGRRLAGEESGTRTSDHSQKRNQKTALRILR